MSFIVYFFVLMIAAGSVLFGLDWVQAPMSPMPASRYELHAAVAPPPRVAAVAEAKPVAAAPNPAIAVPAPPPVAVAAPSPAAPEPAAAVAPQTVAVTVAAAPAEPAPKCDIDACTNSYRSFNVADCTYQPSDGPRRLCTKGTPPGTVAQGTPDVRAQATCNIAACSQAYISFSPTDCTYQPTEGPRRICTK